MTPREVALPLENAELPLENAELPLENAEPLHRLASRFSNAATRRSIVEVGIVVALAALIGAAVPLLVSLR